MVTPAPELKGTIILTGANSSLGLQAVKTLLSTYPSHFAILTVRSLSPSDPNTAKLLAITTKYPPSRTSIEILDLGSLQTVRSFAKSITSRLASNEIPPLSCIVCNAFSWSLLNMSFTADGYESTFQVTYLAHFLLVLLLLPSLDRGDGRIVMLGSEAHDRANKNAMNPLGASLPEDLEVLIHPGKDGKGEEMKMGFWRYANAKLGVVMFVHMLNRKLLTVSNKIIFSFWETLRRLVERTMLIDWWDRIRV
jgi:WW domain-containing oxidoreductase